MRGWRAFWLWAVLWVAQAAPALAQAPALPPIVLDDARQVVTLDGRSLWWIDDARLSVEQVEAADDALPWALREAGRQYRLDDRALWIRFDVAVRREGRWFLELGASGIDRAQLYYRDAAGQWVVQEAGDSRSAGAWPLPGRVPTFELSSNTGRQGRYWLRIEHALVDFAAPAIVAGQAAVLSSREREQFLLGAYFGVAFLIMVVSAAHAIAFRDRAFAAYALYVALIGLGQAAYLGVATQHLWPDALEWNAVAPILLPTLSAAAGLWFVKVVLEPARFSRVVDLAVWGLIAATLAAAAVDAFVRSRSSVTLLSVLLVVVLVAVAALIAYVWATGDDPDIRLIALGFLPVVVFTAFPVLRTLNLIPNSPLTRYGVTIGAALEMPILFYAMSVRGTRRREAEVRAAALARNDALTGLAHRATLLQRLADAIGRARSQQHQCALLGIRIANIDAIVAEHGRDMVDRVMVVAASHLRRCASDIDIAARVGPYELALFVEGPTTPLAVTSRAQQVVAAGLRQAEALPSGLAIRFHVSALMLPHEDATPDACLALAIDGANAIEPDSRKLIRPLNY